MALWRRDALEQLPNQKRLIERAANPMSLWIELCLECEHAIVANPIDRETATRIFAFARRCLEAPNPDIQTAVVVAFYEDIVTKVAVRQHLHEWLSRPELNDLKHIFAYHLDEDELAAFAKEFNERLDGLSRARTR